MNVRSSIGILALGAGMLVLTGCEQPKAAAPTTAEQPAITAPVPAPPVVEEEPEPDTLEPAEDPCPSAGSCRRRGRCKFVEGECVAVAPEDCVASSNCEELGQCSLAGTECVATAEICAEWAQCPQPGRCVLAGTRCGLDPTICQGTAPCLERGLCGLGADGQCVASADGCRESKLCKKQGWCFLGFGSIADVCVNERTFKGLESGQLGQPDAETRQRLMDRILGK